VKFIKKKGKKIKGISLFTVDCILKDEIERKKSESTGLTCQT